MNEIGEIAVIPVPAGITVNLALLKGVFKMINSTTVEQVTSYTPVSIELEKKTRHLAKARSSHY